MAVVTKPCSDLHCIRNRGCSRSTQHGWTVKSTCDCIKTQLSTIAISLTLFNTVRLPREAFKHGVVPYLVVYSFWLLVVSLPTTLLQLAMGQLSQQDPVGVWRAVPILRGIGHLRVLTSFICCMLNVMYVALSLAFLIWIGKDTFPLKDCTKLHITPHGYENKMSAAECFNTTFLAPFTDNPQYLGVMTVIIFILWFFVPIFLYRLHKSLRISLAVMAPIVVIMTVILCTFLSNSESLRAMFESCEKWMPISQPYIWHSALIQALLSTQIVGGYLISGGGTVYNHSDVRWVSTSVILTNLISGWLWVLVWESIGGDDKKDTSFIAILVLIYQSNVSGRRTKEWPMIAYGIVTVSGIITMLTLLFPVYDKIHRMAGGNWRLFATASSAVGTAVTVAILAKGLEVATILDDLVIPILAVFTSAVEVVGFVFIYGWFYLAVDIEFLTGIKLPCIWIGTWWLTPILLLGTTGWWLRGVLRNWSYTQTLWPLLGVFIAILFIMIVMAAIAVAKEEQYNFVTKVASAFSPSRLWGPEEPMARYVWMSQRYSCEVTSSDNDNSSEPVNYSQIIFSKDNEKIHNDNWLKSNSIYQRNYNLYNKNVYLNTKDVEYNNPPIYTTYSVPRGKKKKREEEKFRSPNVCIAKNEIGGPIGCNCNRHFTLNVPDLKKNEVTTSL